MCSRFVPQASTNLLGLTGRSPAKRCCCKPGSNSPVSRGPMLPYHAVDPSTAMTLLPVMMHWHRHKTHAPVPLQNRQSTSGAVPSHTGMQRKASQRTPPVLLRVLMSALDANSAKPLRPRDMLREPPKCFTFLQVYQVCKQALFTTNDLRAGDERTCVALRASSTASGTSGCEMLKGSRGPPAGPKAQG